MFEFQDAPGSVTEMVGCKALELLQFEGDERKARYELIKDQMFWSAMDEGMPRADAWDMSEKVGQWALDLVGRITATGGAGGGHA
jgi:hypothetical protein